MSGHTKGPWHIANGVQIRSDKHQICKVWMFNNGTGVANARLISAAPDLLVALIMVLDDPQALDGRPRTADVVRAAIAKATGETK